MLDVETLVGVRFEVFTAVTMKNCVFWDVTPYGSYMNRRFGRTYRLHHQGDKIGELVTTLAVTSNRRTLGRNTKGERKLEWNTRLRKQRGMGVAGSGVSL
jgi:hypothetical protein